MQAWGRSRIVAVVTFRSVNAPGASGYQPGLQRHHLLPRQLLSQRCFGTMFAELGRARVGFDDFRRTGLLLPATEKASIRTGMPLHRGPHRRYNEVVIARVGRIEAQRYREIVPNGASPAQFGSLDAVDDPAVVAALTDAAEAWLVARGAKTVHGPF